MGKTLFEEMRKNLLEGTWMEKHSEYKSVLRITGDNFIETFPMTKNDIKKEATRLWWAISAKFKLWATFLFLVTGENYTNLQYKFFIHQTTLNSLISEICDEIYKRVSSEYFNNTFRLKTQKKFNSGICKEFIKIKSWWQLLIDLFDMFAQ